MGSDSGLEIIINETQEVDDKSSKTIEKENLYKPKWVPWPNQTTAFGVLLAYTSYGMLFYEPTREFAFTTYAIAQGFDTLDGLNAKKVNFRDEKGHITPHPLTTEEGETGDPLADKLKMLGFLIPLSIYSPEIAIGVMGLKLIYEYKNTKVRGEISKQFKDFFKGTFRPRSCVRSEGRKGIKANYVGKVKTVIDAGVSMSLMAAISNPERTGTVYNIIKDKGIQSIDHIQSFVPKIKGIDYIDSIIPKVETYLNKTYELLNSIQITPENLMSGTNQAVVSGLAITTILTASSFYTKKRDLARLNNL